VGDETCPDLSKERYAMTSHSPVVPLRQPEETEDALTAVLRSGARRLLAQAVEAEAEAPGDDEGHAAAGWA
jgi:hypothetical protein